ncbi:MAG: efflux RND transporter permease subunit [Candidatus Gracilibacteria bacterium]|nr:efflux RND transporter permease subunit [Candidatus Gracilibacteria bacterium]
MIEKFAKFFLENEKITLVIISIIVFFGIGSYIMLPKQYNPSIVAPAFNIQIPVNGYSSIDASQFVAKNLENKVKELEGVDKIMSYSSDNFTSVMVSFKVGISQEIAKTRLYDKMYSNYDLKPFEVQDINIKSIDPEELPQVSLAITYKGNDLTEKETGIYLRSIANNLKEEIKQVENTTVIDIIGGYEDNISIKLNKSKIESFGLDIGQVLSTIKSSSIYKSVGNIVTDTKTSIIINTNHNTKKELEGLIISNISGTKIYLRDISEISSGPIDIASYYTYSDKNTSKNSIFLGVAKMKGTNAVLVVENILNKVEEIKEKLPKNIDIKVIQNEGETAKDATNELIMNLFVSIAIVFILLIIFLGYKNALNAAFCIPMVLGIVFIVALIFGLDINRITLFALILSLGILVDDSIVVIENNSRHLANMHKNGKTKNEAILDSIREVGNSVILSTITRVISFFAMFAVTGMMGDYMKPIPIFASTALVASTFIALSINPFLASKFCKADNCSNTENTNKESKTITKYGKIITKYISDSKATMKSRKILKYMFWISLFVIILSPIMLGIFKARMLPKADKNQVYVWIDAPRDYSIEQTKKIEKDLSNFLLGKAQKLPEDLNIVENVSSTIGDKFLGDFANLFRGGNNRVMSNQISTRINLIDSNVRDIKSEEYTIKIRSLLKNYLHNKYPDIKLRLMEDPPGPPTMATFHIKVKGQEDLNMDELTQFSEAIESTVKQIQKQEKIVDLTNTISSPYKKIEITLNDDYINEKGLTIEQVYQTLGGIYNNLQVSFVRSKDKKIEASKILVGFSKTDTGDIAFLKNIYFTNTKGEKVKLDEIAELKNDFTSPEIYTDSRTNTIHIFAEIGENSVVYPVLEMYDLLGKEQFEIKGYKKISSSPYKIEFEGIKDGKKYRIEWGGEWEITMDTFRDLGTAMIMSLLAIFFLIVAQFKSFRVGGIVMTTFLLSFFGIFPGFSILYLIGGEYFTATAMIGAIALGGIVVGNAILLIDYINQLIKEGKGLAYAVIEGSKKRFIPVVLTSITGVFGSLTITSDPVWSGLARSIIWGLSASAVLTLFFIPIFYYDYLIKYHKDDAKDNQLKNIIKHSKEI